MTIQLSGFLLVLALYSGCARQGVYFENTSIDESSGMEWTANYPEWLFTHNDSGDAPRFFVCDKKGKDLQTSPKGILLAKARNKDWEDMTIDPDGYLYLADIGDNDRQRKDVQIYRVQIESGLLDSSRVLWEMREYDLISSKGKDKEIDAEAFVAVDSGFLLITKEPKRTRVFWGDWLTEDAKSDFHWVADLDIEDQVTSADYDHETSQLIILSRKSLYLYRLSTEGARWSFEEVWRVSVDLGQCEGIAWMGNSRYVISNEQGYLYYFDLDQNMIND